ncbi:hypothetical protein [Acinetobacter sp. ANC 4648]|uniref:hypothetical protein n=1 Tax=Acinetobacter sp. ANC 4648 TaxID=1977875 RepID=UPI000A336E22|nr:hypothetical protein [Acinetobacter sp. ANC 4648]OTG82172.1 hypothetical protein B9T27_07925 [Acinetobacter sp. ANC 4648]
MTINNAFPVLEQIYEFLKENPEFLVKTKFERIVEYLKHLHEGETSNFKFEAPDKIIGKFGPNRVLSLKFVPDFDDKKDFIDWVHKHVNL